MSTGRVTEPLPCPSCGRPTGGQTPCPHCGVAFSPVAPRPSVEPVEADFTRVLIMLGVCAGLLIGVAIGWQVGGPGGGEPDVETEAARGGEDEEADLRDESRESSPGPALHSGESRESSPDPTSHADESRESNPDPPPGMTAAELLAQEEPDEATLVPVQPPQLDVSDPSDAPALVAPRSVKRPGWYEGAVGYERSLVERERGNAPLIVYFHTDWCAYCRRFDDDFLTDRDVATWLNRGLRVEINPEKGDAELALAREFGIRGYPGFFVLRPGSDAPRRVHPFRRGQTISTAQFLSELRDAAGEK